MNEKDQRTLVAFDGLLLAGSPKRKGACIVRVPIGVIEVPKGQFYAPESEVLGVAPYVISIREQKEFAHLPRILNPTVNNSIHNNRNRSKFNFIHNFNISNI